MISAGDFRNGVTLEIDGQVVQILEFQHVKPGKGAAFVRTKIKNVMTGSVVERTFRPTEKFPSARIDRVDMQYLYEDGDLYLSLTNDRFLQSQNDCIRQIMIMQSICEAAGMVSPQLEQKYEKQLNNLYRLYHGRGGRMPEGNQ